MRNHKMANIKPWTKNLLLFGIMGMVVAGCSPKSQPEPATENSNSKEEAAPNSDKQAATGDYDAFAEDMCQCSNEMLELHRKRDALPKEEQKAQAGELQEKINEAARKAGQCITAKYPDQEALNRMDPTQMDAALKEHCEPLYNLMKIGRIKE